MLCLRNISNGSRTIIHHRELPELRAADFEALDLRQFQWLHFEGRRNVADLVQMMERAHRLRREQPATYAFGISLELEKNVAGHETLLPFADVVRVH